MTSALEAELYQQVSWAGLSIGLEVECRFDPDRKWRFDMAWPDRMIAVEVEGGTWSHGRHTTGSGFERDCEKYNRAAQLGWRVFRFTGAMIRDGRALALISDVVLPF